MTFFQLFWQIFKIFVLRLRTASASSGQASTERGLAAPPRLSGGARRLPSPARHLRSVGHRHREHNVHLHPRPPRESTIILTRRPPNPTSENPTSETNITILQFSTKFPHIRQPPNHKLYTNHHPWDPLVSPFIPRNCFLSPPLFHSASRTPSPSVAPLRCSHPLEQQLHRRWQASPSWTRFSSCRSSGRYSSKAPSSGCRSSGCSSNSGRRLASPSPACTPRTELPWLQSSCV